MRTSRTGLRRLLAAAALAACAWGVGRADVITLKNGHTVRGKIIARRPTEIVLQVPSGEITLKHSQIKSIAEESDFDRLMGEGNDLAAQGLFEKAIERYRLALGLTPDAAGLRDRITVTYRNLAQKRLQARDVTGAERALKDLLRFAPGDAEGRKALAEIAALRDQTAGIVARAGLMFDIGAFRESARQYERALALAPGRAEELKPLLYRATVEAGNAYFVQQRYPEASVYFLRATRMTEKPDREVRKRWAYSVLVPVINRINSGRMKQVSEWQTAAALAERVAARAPDVPHVQFVLGLCHEALLEPAAALAAYAKVVGAPAEGPPTAEAAKVERNKAHAILRKDPVRVVVATKDARWLKVEGAEKDGWKTLTTDHFVVFHRNAYVAGKVARAAEYWYAAIIVHWAAPGTVPKFDRKCSIYLYPTRGAFAAATKQPAWAPAVSHVLSRKGKLVDHRLSTYQTVRLLNESILPHELTHIIVPLLLGYPAAGGMTGLPRWVHECTALLEEPDFKRYRFRQALRQYLADKVDVPLARLMAVKDHPEPDDAQRFYAECHGIAEFLMTKGGRRRFLDFMRAAVGKDATAALLKTYEFGTLAEFEAAWRADALN